MVVRYYTILFTLGGSWICKITRSQDHATYHVKVQAYVLVSEPSAGFKLGGPGKMAIDASPDHPPSFFFFKTACLFPNISKEDFFDATA